MALLNLFFSALSTDASDSAARSLMPRHDDCSTTISSGAACPQYSIFPKLDDASFEETPDGFLDKETADSIRYGDLDSKRTMN